MSAHTAEAHLCPLPLSAENTLDGTVPRAGWHYRAVGLWFQDESVGVGILFATKLWVADGWHLVKAEGTYPATGHPTCSGPCTHHGVPIWLELYPPNHGAPTQPQYPPPSTVQGKCRERSVPADTWGRKDLLWGWHKAKLKKRGSPQLPQQSSTQADASGTSHTSITVSLSSALMTREGRGAEKWGGLCHC